jgi:hypothetical protein
LKVLNLTSTEFNQSIDNLPTMLEELYIDCNSFNQPIDYLPVNIRILQIKCYSFNQSLDNLPPNLEILNLRSDEFNQSLDNLPSNLKSIFLCIHNYGQNVLYDLTKLPSQLIYFICHSPYVSKENIKKEFIIPSNFIGYCKIEQSDHGNFGYTISSNPPENVAEYKPLKLF